MHLLLIFFLCLLIVGILVILNKVFFVFIILVFFQIFFLQIKKIKIDDPNSCYNIFKSNNYLGLILTIGLIFGKI